MIKIMILFMYKKFINIMKAEFFQKKLILLLV
uniref:Uncharacterized protein n=1 Tax=viral metagenome TaxID=1070528 RepID=A0A6C0EFK2_9ZZZZ